MIPFWRLSEEGEDNLGLACAEDGLRLGRTPLVERREGRFAVRDRSEIERLLKRAYGAELAADRILPGLATVAAALNADDQCLARIAAVHLRIPDLPDFRARSEIEAEDILIKSADWNPDLHPRAGSPPNPGWFAPTGGSGDESSPTRIAQNDNPAQRSDASPSAGATRVKLAPGERNDELGDLLEWIANARPEDERAIRAEIKRSYYDRGDKLGYEALNAALSDILQPGMNTEARQDILNGIEPYADTGAFRGQSRELSTAASLLLLSMVPFGAGAEAAAAAWELGWAARGLYFSERLGANLPPWFPVIDSWLNGVATSIKSIDLRAATYQSAERLTYRLNKYIDQIALYDGSESGFLVIESSAIRQRVLSLAIPKGSMTAAQRAAIGAARARAEAFGVDLVVTPF
jgi:hypothetical protein